MHRAERVVQCAVEERLLAMRVVFGTRRRRRRRPAGRRQLAMGQRCPYGVSSPPPVGE